MVATLASGAGSAIRALLTSWVLPNEVARLYTALGIIETIGSMGAGPIISGLYNRGIKAASAGAGNAMLGLPWIVVGIIMSALAVVTWILRLDKGDGASDVEGGMYESVRNEDVDEVGVDSRRSVARDLHVIGEDEDEEGEFVNEKID